MFVGALDVATLRIRPFIITAHEPFAISTDSSCHVYTSTTSARYPGLFNLSLICFLAIQVLGQVFLLAETMLVVLCSCYVTLAWCPHLFTFQV